ncbi:MAG: hypothetical protein GX376_08040 [Firmicutes bacterium]|nr:hypothetical protein [Bacillota bacterium]
MTSKPKISNTVDLAERLKERIKEEIMAELQARGRYNFVSAEIYRREIDRLKREIFDEIGQSCYWYLPYQQDQFEPRYHQPNTMDNVIPAKRNYSHDNDDTILDFLGNSLKDREKSIIYGVGMAALLGIFVPSFRRKVQSVATRTAQEGVELMEKARFMLARTKEDIEDLIAEAGLKDFTD